MADYRLEAETRTEFGKGSARRTRRAGRVPAVLYGHGQDVVHLSLPAREFAAALRNGGANALLTVVLDGKEQLALTKAVQRDPIKRTHEHVDLLLVRRGEKTTVDVPIVVVGEPAPDSDPEPPAEHRLHRGRRHEAARQHRGRRHRSRGRPGHHRRRPGPAARRHADHRPRRSRHRLPRCPDRRGPRGRARRGRGRGRHRARGAPTSPARAGEGDVVPSRRTRAAASRRTPPRSPPTTAEVHADRELDPRGRRHCRRPRGVRVRPGGPLRGPVPRGRPGQSRPRLRRQPAQRRRHGARRARRPRRCAAVRGQGPARPRRWPARAGWPAAVSSSPAR